MNWWASAKDMPELANLSENEKLNIVSEGSLRVYGHWQVWVGMVGCLLLGMLGGSLGGALGGNTGSILSAGIAGGIGGCFLVPLVTRIKETEIRKAINERQSKGSV